jgi:hypothetical protein
MNNLIVAVLLTVIMSDVCYAADYYKVSVTRKDSNLYKIDGTDLYIRTKYCYEYATGQKAILVWNGKGEYAGNQLTFIGYDDKVNDSCDVVSLLREVEP